MADLIEDYFRCGSCRAFVVSLKESSGRAMGHCDRRPRHGSVASRDYACRDYRLDPDRLRPGAQVPDAAEASTPRERERRRLLERARDSVLAASRPRRSRWQAREGEDEPERVEWIPLAEEDGMDRDELKVLLGEVLDEALGITDAPIADRFRGGKVIVQPANPELKGHELEIDVLFRKITAVRDRLRVLEQRINGNEGLDHQEKVQLQAYISACYGTLTSFNFLFRERKHWFSSKGEGG